MQLVDGGVAGRRRLGRWHHQLLGLPHPGGGPRIPEELHDLLRRRTMTSPTMTGGMRDYCLEPPLVHVRPPGDVNDLYAVDPAGGGAGGIRGPDRPRLQGIRPSCWRRLTPAGCPMATVHSRRS